MQIPITKPFLSEEESNEVAKAIKSGWVSQGPKVIEFEQVFARYVGTKYAVATSSCTTALHLALRVLGIREDDEMIAPSFSFVATANSIVYCRAKPVFVDIDPRTYNLDPEKIQSAITKRTRAIMVVHQIGLPADMDRILEIARGNNLLILEDAACALGSQYKGRKVGSLSDISCFSFHPRKLITTGEGGMITTDNKELADRLRILRSHGASVSDLSRHSSDKVIIEEYSVLGYNYRLTDIQASIGLIQLRKLDKILSIRRRLAQRYDELLKDIEGIQVPFIPDYAYPNYQSYMIRLEGDNPKFRDKVMEELLKEEISTRRGIMSIHCEPFYIKLFGRIALPETERATDSTMILPLYPSMTESEQDFVIAKLKEILSKFR